MYDKTVTLFNYYESKQAGIYRWYPSVLRNVSVITDKAALLAKYGQETQDSAVMHVFCTERDGGRYVGDKLWLPPIAWENQVNDLLPETLTFGSGDFFWIGEWPDTDPVNDDNYMDGFMDDMARKHDFVFRISSVGGPYSLIPHFEITGR